ncbi:MAG: hypothetical protein LAT53_07215 [Idiomarina sp.]|nr:hypothetical protein [Idiomarina sp.]
MSFELKSPNDFLQLPSESLKKQDDELRAIQRLMRFDLGLSYPVTIMKRERPDFQITESTFQKSMGIEHTLVTNEGWEQACSELSKKKNSQLRLVSRNWLQDHNKKGPELGEDIVSKQKHSRVWCAGESENTKACEIVRAIQRKADKLSSGSYTTYDQNWLLLVDSWPFFSIRTSAFEDTLLKDEVWANSQFDRVLFLCKMKTDAINLFEDSVVELSKSGITQLNTST